MEKTHACLNETKKNITDSYTVDYGSLTIAVSFEGTNTLENKMLNYLKKT